MNSPKRSNKNGGGNEIVNRTQGQEGGNNKYKEFKDKETTDTRSYNNRKQDGQEQKDWFAKHSNFDELIKEMDGTEREAFNDFWAPGHFMRGQQYRGFDNMSSTDQRLTEIYDNYLDRATLDHGVIVTRMTDAQLVMGAGHYTASLEELRSMEGKVVPSKGNMSFGAAQHGLRIGDYSKNIEYRLAIPGGTKGAGMWIGDKRINFWGAEQREFMTNRDILVKVGKTTYDKTRDVYVVNLKYVGRTEHDYGTTGKKYKKRKVNKPHYSFSL